MVATDGSAIGNPGPGGWGWVAEDGQEGSGSSPTITTNNRMELQALIEALKALPRERPLLIQADSKYVIQSLTEWIEGWRANGWRNAKKKPIENVELIKEADELRQGRSVDFEWVRGHTGHELNERADKLATQAARRAAGGEGSPAG